MFYLTQDQALILIHDFSNGFFLLDSFMKQLKAEECGVSLKHGSVALYYKKKMNGFWIKGSENQVKELYNHLGILDDYLECLYAP